jgi:hypothetical protein
MVATDPITVSFGPYLFNFGVAVIAFPLNVGSNVCRNGAHDLYALDW